MSPHLPSGSGGTFLEQFSASVMFVFTANTPTRTSTCEHFQSRGLLQQLAKSCFLSFPLTTISPISSLRTTSSVSVVFHCYFRNSSVMLLNFYFPTASPP